MRISRRQSIIYTALAGMLGFNPLGHSAEPPTCEVCQHQCTRHSISTYAKRFKPRRIVIVTTRNRQDRLKEQSEFARSLADHLRTKGWDAVVSKKDVCENGFPISQGRFDEYEVIRLARDHSADTILYCNVEHFAAYDPMRFQSSLLLVNAAEALTLVSASTTFDLKDDATRGHFIRFGCRRDRNAVAATLLHSPSIFLDFAASEIAEHLANIWTPAQIKRKPIPPGKGTAEARAQR